MTVSQVQTVVSKEGMFETITLCPSIAYLRGDAWQTQGRGLKELNFLQTLKKEKEK